MPGSFHPFLGIFRYPGVHLQDLSQTYEMESTDQKLKSTHLENVTTHDNLPDEQECQKQTAWQCLAQNPWVFLFCLYGNLGAFMYGFDNLVLSLSLSMPGFAYVRPFIWINTESRLTEV
jgi:hypothetical protein